jgi:hypothetical protein
MMCSTENGMKMERNVQFFPIFSVVTQREHRTVAD